MEYNDAVEVTHWNNVAHCNLVEMGWIFDESTHCVIILIDWYVIMEYQKV